MTTRPDQLRILIDGNIIDALATDSQTLKLLQSLRARGAVEVLITFVQVTELNNTRGEDRRQQLLTTLAVLGPTKVATAGIWDCTNWDESKWVGEETKAQLDAVMGNKLRTLNKWADALITTAAAENSAAVVSDNYKDVKKAADRFWKAGGAKLEVWNYADLKQRLGEVGTNVGTECGYHS